MEMGSFCINSFWWRGEIAGFENNVAGMEAVGDGIAAGDSFAFGRPGSGGFPGVTPIGGNLFCARSHGRVLCRRTRSRILSGSCSVCVGEGDPAVRTTKGS